MDTETKSRVLFALVNTAWSTLVLAIAATLSTIGILALDWAEVWPYLAFGVITGAAIGGVRDSRVFQAMVGTTGVVLLAFALYWADMGQVPEPVVPLIGAALISFGTLSTITHVWGRERHVEEPTLADLDAVVSHPGAR